GSVYRCHDPPCNLRQRASQKIIRPQRTDKMKALNKTIVIAGGLALSGVIVASLAVAGHSRHHSKKHRMLHPLSIDGKCDGVLTMDEVMAHSHMRFDRLDADGDGTVTPEEFGARLAGMFGRMDVDKNGILEGDELPRRLKKGGHHHHHGMRKGSVDQIITPPGSAG
ncbi:MAG: hypothetical protein VXY13_03900, partial [Pseudomonadota bacterium]|nr:hypothetical protein [Pseudomonadota bacterium]